MPSHRKTGLCKCPDCVTARNYRSMHDYPYTDLERKHDKKILRRQALRRLWFSR